LIIDDHIDKNEDHIEEPAQYERKDIRDKESPSTGDGTRSLAIVMREKKTEPVRIRVVTGVLSLISKLLVVIPMTGIRSNLRDRISGFIGRLKNQNRKKTDQDSTFSG
jgi:ribosomal protein S17E